MILLCCLGKKEFKDFESIFFDFDCVNGLCNDLFDELPEMILKQLFGIV